jgi:tetratricopeptide (TPR) repeat protein
MLGKGRSAEREAFALDLLSKVTGEGEVRSAASDAQIVEAFAVTGYIHLGRSRISAAEKAFAAALQIDPRSVLALLGDGELLFQSGRFSQALVRFEEAMKADETSLQARIGAAKTMISLERRKDAKELLATVKSDKPVEAGAIAFWRGTVEETLGNNKEAEKLYRDSIKLAGDDPVAVEAYVVLADLLSAQGRSEEAQGMLAEAQSKWPELPALYRAKGELFLLNGRYAEARKEFEAALAKEDNLDTRFKLGVTLRRMRAFEDAGREFDKVAELDKDFPGLALERGLLFEEMGQSERALEMYADALKKAPNDVDLKLRVGSTQVIAGHPAQAEPILREVLKERPGSADANHFLGRALLLKGGQVPEAMRFLEQATNIDGNRAEYHLYVGWAANELGQTPRAEAALARALELDRELADAYWQRGVLLQKQGRTLDALADLETALAKRPTRYEAYATMALCYQEQARWPDALAAWQKAVLGNGSVAEWHYRLGKIHESNGNRLAATPALEKAIELADAKGKSPPVWLFDAHFLFAEAMRASGQKDKAIASYRRYLELAPAGNAYRVDAERALQSLGAAPP